ncbi:MAG: hypothetical protein WBR10_05225 [Candidatus Acidiferrum sp.]
MAPLDQYLMERNAEIALARSAAPESISRDAEVMVLGRHGYESAVKGKNGFVCMVQRSWTAGIGDPDFCNPKLRAAICFNPPAARTYLPNTLKTTELVLAGRSKAQMFEDIMVPFDKKELPALESGAMSYMMSKQSYLSDRDGHWHPHLMFFRSFNGPCGVGQRLAGISCNLRSRGHSGPNDCILDSGRQVVGRCGCTLGRSMTATSESHAHLCAKS